MIRPVNVNEDSPFVDATCALCKASFIEGDKLVVCPEDGALHHKNCWQANESSCSAFGCTGEGVVGRKVSRPRSRQRPPAQTVPVQRSRRRPRSKVRAMPSSNFGCARTCLFISIILALLFLGLGCYGFYVVIESVIPQTIGWQPLLAPSLADLTNFEFIV